MTTKVHAAHWLGNGRSACKGYGVPVDAVTHDPDRVTCNAGACVNAAKGWKHEQALAIRQTVGGSWPISLPYELDANGSPVGNRAAPDWSLPNGTRLEDLSAGDLEELERTILAAREVLEAREAVATRRAQAAAE